MRTFIFVHPRVGILRGDNGVVFTMSRRSDATAQLDRLLDESVDWTMREASREETVRMSLYDGALRPWKAVHLSLNLEAALHRKS